MKNIKIYEIHAMNGEYPSDFTYGNNWRIEAERVNKLGLSEENITDFVNYNWNPKYLFQ